MIRNSLISVAALSLALTLSACGPPGEQAADQPHGYVEGAAEAAEAQPAMAYAARGGRQLHLLDLATEQEKPVGLAIGAADLSEDGRFVYVTDGDRTVEIVDSGVWTVDHTDHVHYYRAPARTLGTIVLDQPVAAVAGAGAYTTVGTTDGRIRVYDRRQLEQGRIAEVATIDSGSATGLAVPYGEGLLVAVGDDRNQPADRIVVMSPDGRETGALQAPCEAPAGWVVLRGGAMITCIDSLVRVKQVDGKLTAQVLASTDGPIPANAFGFRPRSNEAAVADRTGIWSVNAAKATLRHVPADGRDLVAAASPADGRTVLALDHDGALISYDLATGATIAETPLRASALTLDVSRAYLTEPAARVIHEIDYADGLRTARTLRTAEQPDLAVEVGR
ncbi:WD40 repeat domain-containing protein [Actinoplanes derwentensis]|uniref:DNA-binding beta-propeller fold protein YncE n=1 Tax=Actinoplanes derwentensis TaxID=113562 RepID=A0A1H1VG19_9ACTN|nr:WD40 repeat domain-containing protein [Actinoplanes derwentensis]GID83707.1 lipoprotein [Actinoplanes derwentensis]SDS83728.1 hypothetical protein SAMN04489716_1749 [Actinoplanes derwentensis]